MNILEIHLLTNSIIETDHFYSKILGFKSTMKSDDQIAFQIGTTRVYFLLSVKIQNPIYHFAFDIPGNKLGEALDWVQEKAKIIEYEPDHYIVDFVNWNAKSFYFYDNNRNILECITRFDLKNTSENDFNSASFIKISEIGLVTADVLSFCDNLNSEYGLDFYEKQPKSPNFSVVGNVNGLFIVSGKKRNWYPTSHKAGPFWTKVVFENNGKIQELFFNSRKRS
ncbi:VOC family protein [Flavobacterium sp. GT3R68]|uniref:VOC family protein n=1 Tax=Flavobacterium sp. GT3R68 TaxID=2594437 RepID=UPI000F878E11|nr:hypothetical protein [Flavobacterium sp. GT3R68]RTY95358.1 hypothetical protein EKL32_07970 [Flavobacterium sp. GSN2]TRW90902.1 hypothetical protein FNW07_08700 [Flavobacterium sp. GT3R68]